MPRSRTARSNSLAASAGLLRREQRDTLKTRTHAQEIMMQPVVIRPRQSHRPIAIALQADVQTLVRIKHRQRDFRGIEKAQPKLDARMLALVRRERAPRPAVPRKKRILALPRHGAKLSRQKLPQLAITFEDVAVGVNDGKRSFHRLPLTNALPRYELCTLLSSTTRLLLSST